LRHFVLTTALLAALALGFPSEGAAQSGSPEDRRGSNYDPPPHPMPKAQPSAPAVDPDAGKPLIPIQELDWSNKETWFKATLLVGAVVLARRAFRQMKDDY